MTQNEVVALMRSSKSAKEWNDNCKKVKAVFDGYPGFWYSAIILEGVYSEVMVNILEQSLMIDRPIDQS